MWLKPGDLKCWRVSIECKINLHIAAAIKGRCVCDTSRRHPEQELGVEAFYVGSWGGLHRDAVLACLGHVRLKASADWRVGEPVQPPRPSIPNIRYAVVERLC